MKIRRATKHSLAALSILTLLLTSAALWLDNDLHLTHGKKTKKFDAKKEGGQEYYELERIAEFLDLGFTEVAERAVIQGPRGSILMNHNRAIIAVQGAQVTLPRAPLRRKKERWLVPEEFITLALPSILNGEASRVAPFRYEIKDIEVILVEVAVSAQPDRIRVVVESARAGQARISEAPDSLRVRFPGVIVKPSVTGQWGNDEVVQGVEFDSSGNLIIRKGWRFSKYQDVAESASRRVLEIYGQVKSPVAVAAPAPPPPPPPAVADVPADVPAPVPAEDVPIPFVRKPTRGVITLDPGHGGADYGVRPATESMEKNYTVDLAQLVKHAIESRSTYRVVLTRSSDTAVGPNTRTAVSNSYRSEAFISLHFGGSYNSAIQGPQVYVHRTSLTAAPDPTTPMRGLIPWDRAQLQQIDRSKALAQILQVDLNALFGVQGRNPVVLPLEVLRGSTSPAVIVECGFLSNAADLQKLGSEEFRKRLADTVALGVLKYLEGSRQSPVAGPAIY